MLQLSIKLHYTTAAATAAVVLSAEAVARAILVAIVFPLADAPVLVDGGGFTADSPSANITKHLSLLLQHKSYKL